MRSHIGRRGEQNILYKNVEKFDSLTDAFKNLEGKPKRESPKIQYRLAGVGLGHGRFNLLMATK